MNRTRKTIKTALLPILFLAFVLAVNAAAPAVSYSADANSSAQINGVIPSVTAQLPTASCPGGHPNCHFSSPVLYDLTGDGNPEIIVATNNGYVLAFSYNGVSLVELWRRDVAPYFNMSPGTQTIRSSPAVGDVDGNGQPDIVIATGTANHPTCAPGGVLLLDKNGVRKGTQWPKLAYDDNGDGCREGFNSTPALGDLTGDGKLEIVIGGFDKRLYAWRHDGTLLPGFPVTSVHANRFPTWSFDGRLADTIWSSPALADLNGDGFLEIIIGTDEGNFDARYGGDSGGWTCNYALPPGWAPGYCGGALYVVDRFGQSLPGFPKRIYESMQSTPAVADVNGDGYPEIFIGASNFYHDNSPDRPTYGFRIFGWDRFGAPLPGWTHSISLPNDIPDGKVTNGPMPSSPALGDISGDGQANVVALGMDGRLYAWHINGQSVAGFPMTPLTQNGTPSTYNVGSTVILADYTGNGRMEILFNQGWSVTIVNGNGVQLTATSFPSTAPFYYTNGSLLNNPAVGDLNGDGRLQLVAFHSVLHVWNFPLTAGNSADWPMYKRDASRTSSVRSARLVANPEAFVIMHQAGQPGGAQALLSLRNSGELPLDWSLDMSAIPGVAASTTSGTLNGRDTTNVTITVQDANRPKGHYNLGYITLNSSSNSPIQIPVTLVVGDITKIYLPAVAR